MLHMMGCSRYFTKYLVLLTPMYLRNALVPKQKLKVSECQNMFHRYMMMTPEEHLRNTLVQILMEVFDLVMSTNTCLYVY